jgi:hypothetical protein
MKRKSLAICMLIVILSMTFALHLRAEEVLYEDEFDDIEYTKEHSVTYGMLNIYNDPEWAPEWDVIVIRNGTLLLDTNNAKAYRSGITLRFDDVRNYRIQFTMSYTRLYGSDNHFGLLFQGWDKTASDDAKDYRYLFIRPLDNLYYLIGQPELEVINLDRRLFRLRSNLLVDLTVREIDGTLVGELHFDGADYVLKDMCPLSQLNIYAQNIQALFQGLRITELDSGSDN